MKSKSAKTIIERPHAARLISLLADKADGMFIPVGSWRRCVDKMGDIDLLTTTPLATAVDRFEAIGKETKKYRVVKRLNEGTRKVALLVDWRPLVGPSAPGVIAVDIAYAAPDEMVPAMMHFTGSKEFNIAIRAAAKRKGLTLNQYGLFRGKEKIPTPDEAAIFAAVGKRYKPPALRGP